MQKSQNKNIMHEPPVAALARWNPNIKAAASDSDQTINIYDEIGENWEGTGITPKLISSILRKADGKDVTVNINSAGGSFFDGIAIYNILKEYSGAVHVRVVGMAASAASVIAMAGDTIEISEFAFLMIHNSWIFAMGNKNDLQEVCEVLSQFDESMVALYSTRTGVDEKTVRKMMNEETWLGGKDAVDQGFATKLLGEKEVVEEKEENKQNAALRQIDIALAKQGVPRSERRTLYKELSSTPSAADVKPTPCAGDDKLVEALQGLLAEFKKH